MLTIEKLREYGADVDEGLARCSLTHCAIYKLISREKH